MLDELRFEFADHELFYWRDKQRHEMDFVLARRGTPPVAIECKWKAGGRAERNFRFFQKIYPEAKLLIVATDLREPRLIKHRGLVETGLDHLKTAVAMAAEA